MKKVGGHFFEFLVFYKSLIYKVLQRISSLGGWDSWLAPFLMPETSIYFAPTGASIPGGINDDLAFAIGHADLSNIKITINARLLGPPSPETGILVTASVSGELFDVYDFSYSSGGKAENGATVQAGYGTLGNSGHVFQERITLNGLVLAGYTLSSGSENA